MQKFPARLLSTLFLFSALLLPAQLSLAAEESSCSGQLLAEELFSNAGVTNRNFIGTPHGLSAEDITAAGGFEWGLRIYFVSSREEAEEIHNREKNPLLGNIFVETQAYNREDTVAAYSELGGDVSDPSLAKPEAKQRIFSMLSEALDADAKIYAETLGQWREYSPEAFKKALGSISEMPVVRTSYKAKTESGTEERQDTFLYPAGFTRPALKGIMTLAAFKEKTANNRKSLSKVIKMAEKLAALGFRVTINKTSQDRESFGVFADALKAQKHSEGASRFATHASLFDKIYAGIEKGEIVTAEVWDPSGKLVGGSILEIGGSVLKGNTVVYTASETEQDIVPPHRAIDFAKIARLAATQRAFQLGIPLSDSGMVTPFSKGLGAVYVTSEVADAAFDAVNAASLPQGAELRASITQLGEDWNPSTAREIIQSLEDKVGITQAVQESAEALRAYNEDV